MSDAQETRRAGDKLVETAWLTVVARAAAIVMPFVMAGIGAIAWEWRDDFKTAQATAQATALETARVLERVTIRQEVLTKNDDKQDDQIDRLWRRLRGGPAE
jgi:hypothetical protein